MVLAPVNVPPSVGLVQAQVTVVGQRVETQCIENYRRKFQSYSQLIRCIAPARFTHTYTPGVTFGGRLLNHGFDTARPRR